MEVSLKKQILVVDDDQDILNLFKAYFKDSPFNIHTAIDCPKALEQIECTAFDAIFLDILIGKEDTSGNILTFLQNPTNSTNAGVPLIIMSASMSQDYGVGLEKKSFQVVATLKKPLKKER